MANLLNLSPRIGFLVQKNLYFSNMTALYKCIKASWWKSSRLLITLSQVPEKCQGNWFHSVSDTLYLKVNLDSMAAVVTLSSLSLSDEFFHFVILCFAIGALLVCYYYHKGKARFNRRIFSCTVEKWAQLTFILCLRLDYFSWDWFNHLCFPGNHWDILWSR